MPKIQIDKQLFFSLLGSSPNEHELEEWLVWAKAEFDGMSEDGKALKIELNDTNRPDLWSAAGLARQINTYRSGKIPVFPCFHSDKKPEKYIVVDKELKSIRPYIVGFLVSGRVVDEPILFELIQSQEKLCENFGQRRKAIAMGMYRGDMISWPVQYHAANPDTETFIPLEMDTPHTLRAILQEHPKGKEYQHIIFDNPKFPLLKDANGDVLSMPPIINSARLGAVQVGDDTLFIEFTGTHLHTLLLAAAIFACDCSDLGFSIEPVQTRFPYETPMGMQVPCPQYFQEPVTVSTKAVNTMLGSSYTTNAIQQALVRMGIALTVQQDDRDAVNSQLVITVPPYRNDFLHSVDVIEDIMIGIGIQNIIPELPKSFTVGRLTAVEHITRNVIATMVGLGFQEMIFPYLGSRREFIENMYDKSEWDAVSATMVQVQNPISENYGYVRSSIFPSLLASESVSVHSPYPHKICEVGKVVERDINDNYGFRTNTVLGFLLADSQVGFTEVNSIIAAILYYHNIEWKTIPVEDSRFIANRAGYISHKYDDRILGVFGELHPHVLTNFDISMPCVVGELILEQLQKG